jgi:SpoVK/Ycf46/Vps4 family AAA+-type ATPase
LSDHSLRVSPPDRAGARAIFEIHLPPSHPYSPNGSEAMATRRELIDLAIGQIYSPNSPFAQIARIKFRDGSCRTVSARELASGRLFAQICYDTSTRAFRRAKDGGERGLTRADMEDSVAAAISRVAHNLTIHNVRNQFSGLPTDLDVVSVECLLKRVTRPHRYLRAG